MFFKRGQKQGEGQKTSTRKGNRRSRIWLTSIKPNPATTAVPYPRKPRAKVVMNDRNRPQMKADDQKRRLYTPETKTRPGWRGATHLDPGLDLESDPFRSRGTPSLALASAVSRPAFLTCGVVGGGPTCSSVACMQMRPACGDLRRPTGGYPGHFPDW